MKKALAWVLVLALTAAIAVGGTLAYLTDTDEDVNVMTIGKVKIDQLEFERIDTETADQNATVQEFHDNKPLYPAVVEDGFGWTAGDSYVDWEQIGKNDYTSDIWDPTKINNEVDKMVFVKNKGDYDAYVRSVFAFEAGKYETLDQFQKMVHLNLNNTDWNWEWMQDTPVKIGDSTYFVATATYNKVLAPGALTEINLSQIALDPTATNEDVEAFGETYQVLVKTQAIQADGFDAPDTALNEGFGQIIAENIPWDNDSPITGIDLRTALHYYEGNQNNQITTKVTNVIFGLNKDYSDIVDNYDGTLVDIEQDVPVHAYYVPNGSNYDVYFLANDTIYSPKDSSELFYKMSALKTVDTHNFDVSRTENMYRMFSYCTALEEMDVSHFDVSKAVNMEHAFSHLEVIEELDVSSWKPSSSETFRYMFSNNYKLKELDVSNWDVSSAKIATSMFRECDSLTELDLSGWNTSSLELADYMFVKSDNLQTVNTTGWDTTSVTTTKGMFMNCHKLATLPGIESWKLSNNTSLYYMFQRCYALESIDVSNWDTANVVDMAGVFYYCSGLKNVEGLQNWDTGSVTTMMAMFGNCSSLESLDGIENWDTGNVKSMYVMFFDCVNLKSLDVSTWDTGNVESFQSMFSSGTSNTGAMQVTDLDVSNWDTSSATTMAWMFYGCGQLTDLDLSKWDVSNVTSMHHMFADCFKMENYNFTGWNTASLSVMDGIFNSNRALKSVDVSEFDTATVTDYDQIFDGCSNLEEIIGLDQWNTSNGVYFREFLLGTKVVAIDLSAFDMSGAKYTQNMFHVNSMLTTIYVGDNWNLNPNQLADSGMFGSSPKLTGGNGSTIASLGSNSGVYACVDTEENPGLLTHIKDKPVEEPTE